MRKRRATDHRAAVLESVTTTPGGASKEDLLNDCVGPDFPATSVKVMADTLRREGLIGWEDGAGIYFITRDGFAYLTDGSFDRKLPEPHERPKARKTRETVASILALFPKGSQPTFQRTKRGWYWSGPMDGSPGGVGPHVSKLDAVKHAYKVMIDE